MALPVKTSSRTCFGIDYYATEADADEAAQRVRERGEVVNGGLMHGEPCGRATGFDYVDDLLGPLFAVTTA